MRNLFILINTIILFTFSTLRTREITNNRGLFHIRNQFPVNLQFLSFHAENAANEITGSLSTSLQYTHSNTFSMNEGSLNHIRPSNSRAKFVPDINRTGNDYYFDTATGVLNFNIKYGITETISVGIDIPLITYQNGFLDAPIEAFHNIFNIANYNRSRMALNQSDIYIKSDEETHYTNCGIGLGNMAINIKTHLFHTDNRKFEISLLSGLKVPTGSYKKMMGSGSFDYGFNLLFTNIWKKHIISNNLSAVFPGNWKIFPETSLRNFYAWVIGYEYYIDRNWSFIFQHRILTSPLNKTDFPSAAKPAFEWTSGVKIDLFQNLQTSFAITQNYINHENVPDFGFHIGLKTAF